MDWAVTAGKSVATSGRVIRPKKIGLVLKPHPSLILLYDDDSGKLRKRIMPLRFPLRSSTDPRAKAEEVKLRHMSHMERVPTVTVTKLISIAVEVEGGGFSLSEAINTVKARFRVDRETDLNKVSEVELKRQKDLMEITFLSNAVDVNHPAFIYDKQVQFTPANEVSAWDED